MNIVLIFPAGVDCHESVFSWTELLTILIDKGLLAVIIVYATYKLNVALERNKLQLAVDKEQKANEISVVTNILSMMNSVFTSYIVFIYPESITKNMSRLFSKYIDNREEIQRQMYNIKSYVNTFSYVLQENTKQLLMQVLNNFVKLDKEINKQIDSENYAIDKISKLVQDTQCTIEAVGQNYKE